MQLTVAVILNWVNFRNKSKDNFLTKICPLQNDKLELKLVKLLVPKRLAVGNRRVSVTLALKTQVNIMYVAFFPNALNLFICQVQNKNIFTQ